MLKLSAAFIGWVATDLLPKVAPELGKFSVALLGGIVTIAASVIEAMLNMATSMWETLRTAVNWYEIGMTIVIRVRDGVGLMASSLVSKVSTLAKDMWQKFKDIDWFQIGADIIQGMMDGLDSLVQKLKDKAGSLAEALPSIIKDLLGISSPSKVFFAIGQNVMLGFIGGMDSLANQAAETIGRIAENTTSRAKAAGYGASGLIAGVIGGFQGSGQGFASEITKELDKVQAALDEMDTYQGIGGGFPGLTVDQQRAQQNRPRLEAERQSLQTSLANNKYRTEQYEQLKKQADLIQLVRDAGEDPYTLLGSLLNSTTGMDNQKYLAVIDEITGKLNDKLAKSINAVGAGLENVIATLAKGRRTVGEIEGQFTKQTIDQQQALTANVEAWDKYIAVREEALRSGDGNAFGELQAGVN